MFKIGITFNVPDTPAGVFNSGIGQNVIFLRDVLVYIGYDVYLVVDNQRGKYVPTLYSFDSTYKYTEHNQILTEGFDIVIQMGYILSKSDIDALRAKGVKLVAYKCGNDYFLDLEATLFGVNGNGGKYDLNYPAFDEVWSIPQMANTNLHYWKTLYRTNCIEVPFIWSPTMLEQYIKTNPEKTFTYKSHGRAKKCAIFEPNLNTFKWFFPALLVCENACRIKADSIGHVYITNVDSNPIDGRKFNIDYLNKIVKSLDLYKTQKISIEKRHQSLLFMANNADIAVSFQSENPLNYLYLDLAWMGWPIVHNAHLCKDVGYYYEDYNYEMGGSILADVIQHHDAHADEYMARNRAVIDRYLPTNKELQARYKELITAVMQK